MRVRPVMEPWPILVNVCQEKCGPVLSSRVGRPYTRHSPAQWSTSLLELQASFLHFGENRTQVGDGVCDCNLQIADQQRSSEVSYNVAGVPFMKSNKVRVQNFFAEFHQLWYCGQHPIHLRSHALECNAGLPSVRQFSL